LHIIYDVRYNTIAHYLWRKI